MDRGAERLVELPDEGPGLGHGRFQGRRAPDLAHGVGALAVGEPPVVRVMLTGGGEKVTLPYARLRRLEFTGKDTAAGKTWENWVRRYVEKHRAGEHASIESESLD